MSWRGVIAAGGSGSRFHPVTSAISKHLLPIYDKPMIYYPLSLLMEAGVREVMIVAAELDIELYEQLLGDGRKWGISIRYASQRQPAGIADVLLVAEHFIANDNCVLALGDNIFGDTEVAARLLSAMQHNSGATAFARTVETPTEYCVAQLTADGRVLTLKEKPLRAESRLAVLGLYLYDRQVLSHVRALSASTRGELEVTDLNVRYLEAGQLRLEELSPDAVWFDAGTPERALAAASHVRALINEGRQLGCPEEVAFKAGWISREELHLCAESMRHSDYGCYLRKLSESEG